MVDQTADEPWILTICYLFLMDTNDQEPPTEISDDGCPIEIYTDERIAEFLSEDTLTPELKKWIDEKLRQPKHSEE